MEVNTGNGTYTSFHKSFSRHFETTSNMGTAFRCTPAHDSQPSSPLLPPEDATSYAEEPEYDTLRLDLSHDKNISVSVSPYHSSDVDSHISSNTTINDESVSIHAQAKTYEEVQHATASFSLQDFADATYSSLTSEQRELLSWYNRLGHLPFSDLQHLVSVGSIPRRLANCEHPKCVACIFGQSHRRPWRAKGKYKKAYTLGR